MPILLNFFFINIKINNSNLEERLKDRSIDSFLSDLTTIKIDDVRLFETPQTQIIDFDLFTFIIKKPHQPRNESTKILKYSYRDFFLYCILSRKFEIALVFLFKGRVRFIFVIKKLKNIRQTKIVNARVIFLYPRIHCINSLN